MVHRTFCASVAFTEKNPLIPIAVSALVAAFFALAQELCEREKDPAFQASSPKNFQAGLRVGLFLSG
jgi:hypothetical protein